LWRWRDKLGRGPTAAIVFFVVTLSPILGFISLYTFIYTYVTDHYQYVASIGPITLIVAASHRLIERFGRWKKGITMFASALVLATLGTLTWHQSHIYKDLETLWRDTIQKNPNSYLAQNNLGIVLGKQDKFDEAISHFRKALSLKPDDPTVYSNLGTALSKQGKLAEAIGHFRKALSLKPDNVKVMNILALTLATTADNKIWNPKEGAKIAEKACELTDYKQPEALDILAMAYAAMGRFAEAEAVAEKAINLALAGNQRQLADEIKARLQLYKVGQRYRKQP
jgi:tetratricopeptide (TPR) repeat protein